jgi:hypothetical protein
LTPRRGARDLAGSSDRERDIKGGALSSLPIGATASGTGGRAAPPARVR